MTKEEEEEERSLINRSEEARPTRCRVEPARVSSPQVDLTLCGLDKTPILLVLQRPAEASVQWSLSTHNVSCQGISWREAASRSRKSAETQRVGILVMPSSSQGTPPPSNPSALNCLVPRDSALASLWGFTLRILVGGPSSSQRLVDRETPPQPQSEVAAAGRASPLPSDMHSSDHAHSRSP